MVLFSPTSADCTPTSAICTPTSAVCTPTSAVCSPTPAVCTPTLAICTPTLTVCSPPPAICPPRPAVFSPTRRSQQLRTLVKKNLLMLSPVEVYLGQRVHSTLMLPRHFESCESILFRLDSLPLVYAGSESPSLLLPPIPPVGESSTTIPRRSCFHRRSSEISFGARLAMPELNYPGLCEFHLCPLACSYFHSDDSALVFILAFVPGPSGNGAKCLPYWVKKSMHTENRNTNNKLRRLLFAYARTLHIEHKDDLQ